MRLEVVYHLTGTEAEARAKAADICLEQTVELPDDLVTDTDIRQHIFGQVVSFRPLESSAIDSPSPDDRSSVVGRGGSGVRAFEAAVSFAIETAGEELTQLLNLVFGNISLKPGIRLERLDLPDNLLLSFKGPRFGREGVRAWLGVPDRPLLCTALKPMGLPAPELADLAYRFALGGIDIVKDDHGLTDQVFCRFEERVQRCAEAVERANRQTGLKCIYMSNVTAPADRVVQRALFAKKAGVGGLLISPGLTGLDTMRQIADDDRIALPIMSHPALQGTFVASRGEGISHFALFGQIARLGGADASIFPNYGGRFFFTRDECRHLAEGAACLMGHIQPIFPTPAGGMSLDRVPEMRQVFGREVIFLIGAGLRKHGPDLVENCRYFKRLVEENW